MRSFVTKNWKILTPVAAVGLVVVAYLAFAVFGIQTLFTDKKVDEAGPVFDSGVSAQPADEAPTEDTPADEEDMPADEPSAEETPADEEEDMPADEPEEPAAPVIETVVSGNFIDRSHPAEGDALVLTDGSAQRFLRFENFATDNGPDLNVYLSAAPPDADASAFDDDFVDLGDLKGNIGDQNYEIPEDVDLDRYTTVVIWCVRFGVAFGAAELA